MTSTFVRFLAVGVPAGLLLVVIALSPPDPAGAGAATIVVDTTSDANLTACTGAVDDCTLRGAINIATPNDTIAFNIVDAVECFAEICPITPDTALPAIVDAGVTIDGYTQPAAVANSAGPGQPTNAVLKIVLNGGTAPVCTFCDALTIQADNVTIKGLDIILFEGNGIQISNADNAVIEGNWIGVNVFGTLAAPNSNGVRLDGGVGNRIGGTTNAARNVISGNQGNPGAGNGVVMVGSQFSPTTDNVIQGNVIGLNAPGSAGLGNAGRGITLSGADNNLIGGNTAGARNTISGQANSSGIAIIGESESNVVAGNYIGTNITGGTAIPNSNGVLVSGGAGNVIGGDTAGERNVISGNSVEGVRFASTDSGQVSGNYIGTDPTGMSAIPNGAAGVSITAALAAPPATDNLIGGDTAGERNVISGNGGPGVRLDMGSTGNTVSGNYIGTNAAGTAALANSSRGVYLEDAPGNIVGGNSAGERNVISGNGQNGVQVYLGEDAQNTISGNYIGTNATGTVAIPNDVLGVVLEDTSGNLIGGTAAGTGNLISGNVRGGILVTGGSGNAVHGNFIGLDAAGESAVPNLEEGVTIDSDDNFVGSTVGTGRNIISGNVREGIHLVSGERNQVVANLIGTAASGAPLGNGRSGIEIEFADNSLIEGNTIAHNGLPDIFAFAGVVVPVGTGNTITENSIHSNLGLGIDLFHTGDGSGGVSPNDPGDGDGVGNNGQNFPELDSAQAGSLTVEGSLNSTPNTTYRIEFFTSPECDDSGNGEGEVFLGGADVVIDGDGVTTFTANSPADVEPGDFVTATATNLDTGDTSEFSNCVEIQAPVETPTPVPTDTPVATPTGTATATPGATNTATPTPTTGPTETATPTPTPTGKAKLTQGDVDCDGDVDSADALKQLRYVAELSVSQEPGCPQIGAAGGLFADVDCDGDVDAADALKVLRHVAALSVSQTEPCADIGEPL